MQPNLSPHNGWENKFTWLVHLHLSNEQRVMQELTYLVAGEPNDGPAGRLVEMWVNIALNNWLTGFPGRNWGHDEAIRLLAWDLAGSALAYADWDILVRLLMGEKLAGGNLFTWTLYRCIRAVPEWQQQVGLFMQEAASLYACADALKDWMRELVDEWMETDLVEYQHTGPVLMLVTHLIANTYTVINWWHVARAFRPEA